MEKYFTCEQVAERYGVKRLTVWSWIRDKKLKAIRTGKNYSIPPQALIEFEKKRATM